MDPNNKEYTVTVSKKIQEKQFEPLAVTITTRGVCPAHLLEQEQAAAYNQIKSRITEIFNSQPTFMS